jgi:VCBS repeat-containing protein
MMRLLLLLAVAATALSLSGCGSGYGSNSGGSTAATPAAGSKQVAVSAQEFSFDPGTIQIDRPGTYTFTLTNDGSFQHALEVEGQGVEEETDKVDPGSTDQVTITFSKTGSYEFYCPVDGHRGKGMEGTLTVGAASPAPATTEDNSGGTDTSKTGYGYG